MKLYVISLPDSAGRMQSYGIVADSKAPAVAKARELAGVGEDVETSTEQMLHTVDAIVEA